MGMRERTWFLEQKKHHNAWVGILFSVDLHTSYVYAGSEPHSDTASSQSCASSWYIANITLYYFYHNIFTNVWLHVCHANYTPPPTVSLCASSDVTQKTIQVRQHMYHGVAWTPCIHAHPPPHPTTGRDLRLSLTSNYPSKKYETLPLGHNTLHPENISFGINRKHVLRKTKLLKREHTPSEGLRGISWKDGLSLHQRAPNNSNQTRPYLTIFDQEIFLNRCNPWKRHQMEMNCWAPPPINKTCGFASIASAIDSPF